MILSIVIVNWNTGKLLADCVESVYADLPARADQIETLIVDNASSDGSAQAVEARFPQVRVIYNRANPGFAAGNNQAIRLAQGQVILLLNPDTLIRPGAIACLMNYMDAHPQVGAVGPRLLNPDGSLQYSCSPEPSLKREFLRLFHLGGVRPDGYEPMETWNIQAPHRTDVLLGACILARRSALGAVGGFDEAYFMYSEEVDLCHKLRSEGWELYWVPQAQVVHYGGQSTRLAATEMFLQLYRAKVVYFRRHSGRFSAQIYKLILMAAALPRMAGGALAPLQSQENRRKSLSIAQNYARLLARLPGM